MLRFWTVWWNNMKSLEAKSVIILLSFLFYLRNISFCDDFMDLNRLIVEAKKIKLDDWILRAVATAEDVANCFFQFSGLMIVFVLRSHFLEQPWKRARKWINKLISEWASERVVACVREWVSKRLIERESW